MAARLPPPGSATKPSRAAWPTARIHSSAAPCAACNSRPACNLAHLDQDAANNAPDNLARLCPTHHWMYDAGLYAIEAIRLLQTHWQATLGEPDHKARMKDAGAKAALARKRGAAGRKAVATRRVNAARRSGDG